MRDFRQDELNAVRTEPVRDSGEFSWSLSRHIYFRQCPLAYYIRYYFSQGGWDIYADPSVRLAWEEKKNLPWSERLERIFESSLRETLDSLRFAPPDLRMSVFATRFEICVKRRLERLCGTGGGEMYASAFAAISGAVGSLAGAESFRMMVKMQNLTQFNQAFQPEFQFGETPVWYDPGIIWREGKTLCSLRTSFRSSGEYDVLAADIFALSLETRFPGTKTISFFRHPKQGTWEETSFEGDARHGAGAVEQSIREMKAKESDETADIRDFEFSEDNGLCEECVFRRSCDALRRKFGLE